VEVLAAVAVALAVVAPVEAGKSVAEMAGHNVGIALACQSKCYKMKEASDGRAKRDQKEIQVSGG
jgi:hypothetical protein